MNENDKNITVDMPTDDEYRQQQMTELVPYLLDATENYPEPIYMLEYNGVPFSPIGGLQAISGQKKNGKTFLVSQLMAAVLGTDCDKSRTPSSLPGLRVPERTLEYLRAMHHNDDYLPTVLFVDTEMEKLNSAKVLRRVHWLCGWQMDVPAARFHVLWLRSVTKDEKEAAHTKRLRLMRLAIDILHPDVVFLDGIRDVVGDFNDNAESSALVTDLMALAEEKQICIWNTLHMNPRPRNDDESKMRGHLGTELGNKITDTLVCIKHKEKGSVWFTVKQDDARGKDMDDWEFIVTDAAGSLGVPQMRHVATPEEKADAEVQRARIEADDYFKLYTWTSNGATYTDLEKFLRSKGVTSNRRIGDIFDTAKEAGIIYKTGKKYHYGGLERNIPNDEAEPLPFDNPSDEVPY